MADKYEKELARRQQIARERQQKERELLEQRAKERKEQELAAEKEKLRKQQEIKEKLLQDKKRVEEECKTSPGVSNYLAKLKVEQAQANQHQTDLRKFILTNLKILDETQTSDTHPSRPRNLSTTDAAPVLIRCVACGMKFGPTVIPIEHKNERFHENCFKCAKCSKKIGKNKYTETNTGVVLCEECSALNVGDFEREKELRIAQKYFQNMEVDKNRKPYLYKVNFILEESSVSLEFRHREFQYEELLENELQFFDKSKEIKEMERELQEKLLASFPSLQKISEDTIILLKHSNVTYPLSVIVRDSELLKKTDVDIITVQKDQLASSFPAIYFALEAQNAALDNQFDRALELCDRALEIEKYNFYLINLRSTILFNLHRNKEAMDILLSQSRTGYGRPYLRVAVMYYNDKKYEDACIYFFQAGAKAGIRAHGGRQILEVYGRKSLWAQPLNLLTWFTPLVVIRNIFSFLDSKSLARASRVCVQLRDIASDNLLWKNLCLKDFMMHPKFELQNFKSHYIHLRDEKHNKGIQYSESRYFRFGSGLSFMLFIEPSWTVEDLQRYLRYKSDGTPVAFFLHTHPEHLISLPFLLTYAVNKTFFGKDEVLNVALAEKAFCKNCLNFYDEEKNTENSCWAHTGNIHLSYDARWKEKQGYWDCCRARYWEKEVTVGCTNTYHKKDEQYVQFVENLNGLCKREGNEPMTISYLPKDPLHFELWKKAGQKYK